MLTNTAGAKYEISK